MSQIFTNNYYVNGLQDWCVTSNCTAHDLATCSINNHTTRKVLFVGDINREWIKANIKPTYECAYISRVIESLLYIRLAGSKELESLLQSDAEDAVLRRVEHLTLNARSKAKAPKRMDEDEDMNKKVSAEEMDELNRVQYLIATDFLHEGRQDDDSDIKLESPSVHHTHPSDSHDDDDDDDDDDKDYISLEDTSCYHPDDQNNNKNIDNGNKDKGKDKKDDNQASIPDSGINIDSDMWRLHSIRYFFEVMYKHHKRFPEEPKIHVSFTQHYLRKLATIQKYNAYMTVQVSKAPPRPIVETFMPGFSAKQGHKQERKRLRMDRSGGGGRSGHGGLEEVCKLFQERILKKQEDERKEREIALMRKWNYTMSVRAGEDDGDEEKSCGDDDDEEENDQLEEDCVYGDIRPKDEKGDPDLEQNSLGMKRLRLEEDDDDDCDDEDL
ncbi:hypothetical protein BG006_003306 [Podila minutissima]|uniref:Uncharacterized protein n=1 Tax=Podila minutissima TaxID=64525 RepID=A0A9P5VNA3_9FUNG|nr:hypothetical protein BG006_003306 [Podila minutissima]